MMVQMDKLEAPSRENAQRLYDKNVELENSRRRSVKARIPTDPNAWQQMRENYEGIILGNHDFSEQHNTEYLLWQLHYRRIEEFRAHFSAALSSSSSTSQSGKIPTRPDRITKIRMQFKAFLSEATGFYHDLILKIKAKYGLPLGHFSEESENQIVTEKDGQKYVEMKKGLISCHRCLIYLGDLARYKGLYGEGDSKTRDYTAASSYYLQASSLWPSSGNPHHQLAILASYAGDELVSVYRYFRSLAVESPFSTARDNLIVAFEKNRQAYSEFPGDPKPAGAKESSKPVKSKGRGKGEARISFKDNFETSPVKGETTSMDTYKLFCTCFVRLNGILFTRTSLETFANVLWTVSSGLNQLLSSGPDEELNFCNDAAESGLSLVRLVAILIFTVHNVNRDAEGQSYADILQRKVLLQNASIAIFEFMGRILKSCSELRDASSSCLLPGILVFMEWLASRQDVASGNDVEVDQAAVRSVFWNNCVSFLNSLLSNGLVSMDDEDETCFFNMSTYEEGETENRLALWEDIELRGFLPLLPAQSILDFSRKPAFGIDGNKEKKARIKRILAAGKVVTTFVKVDQKPIFFASKEKRFSIGIPLLAIKDISAVPKSNGHLEGNMTQNITYAGDLQMKEKLYEEPEEEDEEIVFKPIMMEKRHDAGGRTQNPLGGIESVQNTHHVPSALNDVYQQAVLSSTFQPPIAVSDIHSEQLHAAPAHTSKWLEQEAYLANGVKNLGFLENGHVNLPDKLENIGISHPFPHPHSLFQPPHEDVSMSVPFPHPTSYPQPSLEDLGTSVPFPHPYSLPHPSLALHANVPYNQTRAAGSYLTSRASAIASPGIKADGSAANPLLALPDNARKIPVSRPHRHLGPPPGFNHPLPSKQVNVSRSSSDQKSENQLLDDYSWLDGYQLPSSSSIGVISSINQPPLQASSWTMNASNGMPGMTSFPFPGKQASKVQSQVGNLNSWQHHVPLEGADQLLQGQQMHYLQQYKEGNQQFIPLPEQYQGNPSWSGRHLV